MDGKAVSDLLPNSSLILLPNCLVFAYKQKGICDFIKNHLRPCLVPPTPFVNDIPVSFSKNIILNVLIFITLYITIL